MLRSYMLSAVRAFAQQKLFSIINILGLAVGLASCILMLLFVRYETSYDAAMPDADRIYQVNITYKLAQGGMSTFSTAPIAAKAAFEQEFDDIEAYGLLTREFNIIEIGGKSFKQYISLADAGFFDVIDIEFIEGGLKEGFNDLSSVIISRDLGIKFFGAESPVGRTISVLKKGGKQDFVVSGVFKDFPDNSQFGFQLVRPFDPASFEEGQRYSRNGWRRVNTRHFFKLQQGVEPTTISSRLSDLVERYVPSRPEDTVELFIIPLKEIHFYSWEGELNQSLSAVYAFSAVTILVLIVAIVNFVNLSVVRSFRRMKEVGLRKTVGASRKQLFVQFFSENMLLTLLAMISALFLVEVCLPFYNEFLGFNFSLDYMNDPLLPIVITGVTLTVGTISGVYPALYLSSFNPIQILQANSQKSSAKTSVFSTVLTLVQFAISIVLVVSTLVVYMQNRYIQNKDLGFSKDNKIIIEYLRNVNVSSSPEVIKQTLSRVANVKSASLTTMVPTNNLGRVWSLYAKGRAADEAKWTPPVIVDFDYFDTYEIKLLHGRLMSKAFARDTFSFRPMEEGDVNQGSMILNVAATSFFGFDTAEDAIGETLVRKGYPGEFEIVGVVSDYHFNGLWAPVRPIVHVSIPSSYQHLTLAYDARTDVAELIENLTDQYALLAPGAEIQYRFMDQKIDRQYRTGRQQMVLLFLFSGLALFVTVLGLYGFVAFSAEMRRMEIGLRKIHGASISEIIRLIVTRLFKPILLANVIAWPLAWYFMQNYLEGFAFRIDLQATFFIAGGVAVALVAMLTMASQVFSLARTRPVETIRQG